MTTRLNRPTERECIECGRHETWKDDPGTWTITNEASERLVGDPFCIHAWDINGTHDAIQDRSD